LKAVPDGSVSPTSWAFPSFNVADAGISVGAALLIIDALFFFRTADAVDGALSQPGRLTAS